MKPPLKQLRYITGQFVLLGLLVACNPNALPPGGEGAIAPTAAPTIDEFDFDEIAGGGCGMALRRSDRSPQDRQYVLFNNLVQDDQLNADVRMEMKIDGAIVTFSRTDYQGEPFAAENYPLQTFTSTDGFLVATVAVDPQIPPDPEPGAPASGETAVVSITGGTVTVERAGQTTSVEVVGDAGC